MTNKPKECLSLRELDASVLWRIIESLKAQYGISPEGKVTDCTKYRKSQIRGIEKRFTDVTTELKSRIEHEDYLCSMDRFYVLRTDPGFDYFDNLRRIHTHHNEEITGANCKHKCKVPVSSHNGMKKVGFDKKVSSGANRIRVDRSKIKFGRG